MQFYLNGYKPGDPFIEDPHPSVAKRPGGLPEDADVFTHRVGRTGRAGKTGVAVTFVGEWDFDQFDQLRAKAGVPFRREILELYDRH